MNKGDLMTVDPEKELRTLLNKFDALGNITRATWYEWRQAAIETARPEFTPLDLVLRAWEVVGHDTAKAYYHMLDKSKPTFIEDIAKCIVMSSTMMGEDAEIVESENENEVLRHVVQNCNQRPERAVQYECKIRNHQGNSQRRWDMPSEDNNYERFRIINGGRIPRTPSFSSRW
jgi:hypothetical protein